MENKTNRENTLEKQNLTNEKELPKKYNPAESEIKWQKFWEENNIYSFDAENPENIYSIDTPPQLLVEKCI